MKFQCCKLTMTGDCFKQAILCRISDHSVYFSVDLLTSYSTEYKWLLFHIGGLCLRPYHTEYTGSRLITEVKQCWACSVLGWVTA